MLLPTCLPEVRTEDGADNDDRPSEQMQHYETLRRALVRAVQSVCPRALANEAEDLVQDAFIRLMRARALVDGATLSMAYLKKVAYSAVIDEIRRRQRQPGVELSARHVQVEEAADTLVAATPDAALGEAIERSLQQLQPDRRRALTLHLLGYTGDEVATFLGCNTKRADNLTHRGLAQVRGYLSELGVRND
ncbi:MAG: RNA polymerase sigma factor [Povalibacter sp.]